MSEPALPEFGPEEFAVATNVSRETLGRLKIYVGLLRDWNAQHNLVSAGSLADVWRISWRDLVKGYVAFPCNRYASRTRAIV